MPRPGRGRAAVWALALLAGAGVLLGPGRAAPSRSPDSLTAAATAARTLGAVPFDDRIVLPPGVLDRANEAVGERPRPLRGSTGEVVLATALAALPLAALAYRASGAAPSRALSRRGRPQAPRAPPATA